MFFKIYALKISQYSKENICVGVSLKLQACNVPVNIAKFFKNSFFNKTPAVTASEKFINFPKKYQWRRRNRFILLINTTE